jgi:hypothetical protein
MDSRDARLRDEGDAATGSEGDPGPTGSSTHGRATPKNAPGEPRPERNQPARERRPGLGGGGNDRVETIDDVTEGGTSAGGTSERANRG